MRRPLLAIVLVLASARVSGQGIPLATLHGVVSAEDGKPIAGVMVRVSSPALQGMREATTSRTGEYFLALLPPGDYQVRFAIDGMTDALRTITLPAAATVRLDQILRPASVDRFGTRSHAYLLSTARIPKAHSLKTHLTSESAE